MKINYLDNIKVGQKIDLDRFKKKEKPVRPEEYLPDLEKQLETMAQEINKEFPGFLTDKGKVALLGEDANSDAELVESQELAWAQETSKDIDNWRDGKEKNPGNITEMALTIVFNKFLREKFVVARASDYDDYNNGVDQIIIDKETGAVVCGFDEVIGHNGDDGGNKKSQKIQHKMESGGAKIKYGATIEDGELIRKKLKNIPAFYVAISKEELNELLLALKSDSPEPSQSEKKVFVKLLNSLQNQSTQTENWDLDPALVDNLNKFKESLDALNEKYKLAA